jgi:hypothetical protein
MNDLEMRVRDTLERHLEVLPKPMPEGTVRRVRRRQAVFVTLVSSVVVVSVVGAVTVVRLGALEGRRGPADGRPGTIEALPAGWPDVHLGDPSVAYVPFPGGENLLGRKHVLASGSVDGAGFSLLGFTSKDEGDCFEFTGPYAERKGTQVGGSCADIDVSVPADADLDLLGFSASTYGHIEANMGFVSARVHHLAVIADDGSSFPIPILDGPRAWDGRSFFLVFRYEGVGGHVVAYDEGGGVLARASLCAVPGDTSGGCRGGLEQIVPPPIQVSSGITWPIVARDPATTPDFHEDGPGPSIGSRRTIDAGEVSLPGIPGRVAYRLTSWISVGNETYPRGVCLTLSLGQTLDGQGSAVLTGEETSCIGKPLEFLDGRPAAIAMAKPFVGADGRALYAVAGLTSVKDARAVIRAESEERDLPIGVDGRDGYLVFFAFAPIGPNHEPVGRIAVLESQVNTWNDAWSADVPALFSPAP